MQQYSDDEQFTSISKTLKTLQESKMFDSEVLSKIFKKLKKKDIFNQPIKMKLDYMHDIPKMEINDYIDQFIYYRKLKGYTQEQVGQVISVTGKEYYKYEKRIRKLNDIQKIQKIADFLGIEEKLKKLPLNDTIDNQQLKKYLIHKKISNTEFSRLIGVSRRSIVEWFNHDVKISEENCKKVKKFIKSFEEIE